MFVQQIQAHGRPHTVTWMPPPFQPPLDLVKQSLGLCFTGSGEMVLVSPDHRFWTLPGGKPEPGESPEQALVREVWEEARARVTRAAYLGCQRVDDPTHPDGPEQYFQVRFWARVELEPFVPEHEMIARRVVTPGEFLRVLSWGDVPVAAELLRRAMAVEADNG